MDRDETLHISPAWCHLDTVFLIRSAPCLAGAFTAIGIGLVALYLTPWLYYLPIAILAATIIVAVLSLVDIAAVRRTWRYTKGNSIAMIGTILVTLSAGVEFGVSVGVVFSGGRVWCARIACVVGG